MYFRGVAKLVSHRIWDAGIARSSRVTPTSVSVHKGTHIFRYTKKPPTRKIVGGFSNARQRG